MGYVEGTQTLKPNGKMAVKGEIQTPMIKTSITSTQSTNTR